MKLLDRYNRVTLLTTIIVMLITGIIYYLAISLILTNQVDKDLLVEEQEIFDFVKLNHHLPQVFESSDQQITFQEANPGTIKREFINTEYKKPPAPLNRKHHHRHEYETGRALITSVAVGNKFYRILIVESTVETEDLIKIIFAITIAVILLLLVTLFITNRLLLTRLWQPFNDLLKELRLFNIADNKDITPMNTHIEEFRELDTAIASMSSRVKNDYRDLKTFTENASHELLTPIAVINSKLDNLIQTENFSLQQSKLLNDLYGAVSKLTRLNQSLILLVKIENHLVSGNEPVNLRQVIDEMIIQFDEIFQDKGLKVSYQLDDKEIRANPYLIDVLLNNLISNAIRHNHKGGEVLISLTGERLSISNTGENEALEKDKLFKRFYKSSSSEGSGLGLTISRQICENLGLVLSYEFKDDHHVFTVKF